MAKSPSSNFGANAKTKGVKKAKTSKKGSAAQKATHQNYHALVRSGYFG